MLRLLQGLVVFVSTTEQSICRAFHQYGGPNVYSQTCRDICCAVEEWKYSYSGRNKKKNNNNKTEMHRLAGSVNNVSTHNEEEEVYFVIVTK